MRRMLITLIVLGAFAFQSGYAQSQQAKDLADKISEEIKKIDARLKLTPEQKTQLRGIMETESAKLDALYKEYEPREDAIVSEARGKMKDVLTPEQQKEWAKIKEEYSVRWKEYRAKQKAATVTKTKPETKTKTETK